MRVGTYRKGRGRCERDITRFQAVIEYAPFLTTPESFKCVVLTCEEGEHRCSAARPQPPSEIRGTIETCSWALLRWRKEGMEFGTYPSDR